MRKLQFDIAQQMERAKRAEAASNLARMEASKTTADSAAESQRMRSLVAALRAQIAGINQKKEPEVEAAPPPPPPDQLLEESKAVAQLQKRAAAGAQGGQ